jgi:DNA-binding response OmpR family regulator
MTDSVLNGKKILAVDDEPDVLAVLEEEILDACPKCELDKATTYEEAMKKLESKRYDVVILDIMGVRGFDLLEVAVGKKLNVAMLTAHALNPEALKKARDMKARAYLPKDKMGEIVPFLEDMLTHEYESAWKHLLEKLGDYFDKEFEPDWRQKIGY